MPQRCASFLLILFLTFAATADSDNSVMNGYRLAQFGDFVQNWKLVTVRYRKDTKEMRFTYANPEAWETLQAQKTDYPDGAVFAKVGIVTADDPLFPSSATPMGARRVQFMVREKKRHSSTDGWGYALFNERGQVFPGDLGQASMACAACHRVAEERGYVFSQSLKIGGTFADSASAWHKSLLFSEMDLKALPSSLRKIVPKDTKLVRRLQGELGRQVFFGTLDEIRPLLAAESVRSKQVTALISEDGKLFSAVVPDPNGKCESGQFPLKGVHTLPGKNQPLFEIRFCQDAKS